MVSSEDWAKFEDRQQAGNFLAGALGKYAGANASVFAIPCGGAGVGAQVAMQLGLPLYPLVVQRICLPLHEPWSEVRSIGAVASESDPLLDLAKIASLRLNSEDVRDATRLAEDVGARRTLFYGGVWPDDAIRGKLVLVVDDAIDTGNTMQAAVRSLQREQPAEIILATPIGSANACRRLAPLVSRVICPVQCGSGMRPHDFYLHHGRVSDAEAFRIYQGVRRTQNQVAS
jgi:putative phosphoribosyl transferase